MSAKFDLKKLARLAKAKGTKEEKTLPRLVTKESTSVRGH